jgi:tetratricopeptide (TPR) repeat protein
MDSVSTVLTGARLEELLDRLEADLDETGSPEKIDLKGRLCSQKMRADSLRSIARVCSLWLRAGDTAAAWATIDADGEALLESSAPTEKASLAMRLQDYRLQIASSVDDEATCLSAIDRMKALVPELGESLEGYREMSLLDSLEHRGLKLALAAIDLRHAIDEATPSRAANRAWDSADFHERRALAYHRSGNTAEAIAEANAAVTALKSAGAGQSVGEDDWLVFGDSLVELIPAALQSFCAPVITLTKEYPLPQRREYEVQVARLEARALHAQGNIEGALKACEKARYCLTADGFDDFAEFEVPWLIEAGKFDEAGRTAFFHIYQCESETRSAVARAVHARLAAADEKSYWWAACLLRASTNTSTMRRLVTSAPVPFDQVTAISPAHASLFGPLARIPEDQRYAPTQGEADGSEEILDTNEWTEARDEIMNAARKLCEERSPGNPWTVRLTAYEDMDAGRIDAQTKADLLLKSVEAGKMRDNRSAFAAFFALADQKGILHALRQPAPTLPAGLRSYNFIADIWDEVNARIEELAEADREEAKKLFLELKRTVYEQGLACMEAYFKTGAGHPYDAGAHLYSMMCNNLAGTYHSFGRYDDSLELHRRGIEACPFAEHYDGVFRAWWAKEDDEKMVKAAEDLWQYAATFGYGSHDLNLYVPAVSSALGRLERWDDKLIWLERLVQWQREMGEAEGDLSKDAIEARVDITVSLGGSFPEEAKALWSGIEAQVRASGDAELILNAGSGAYNRDDFELAIELWAESMKCNPRKTETDMRNYAFCKETTEKAKQKLAESGKSQKRAWQFWK